MPRAVQEHKHREVAAEVLRRQQDVQEKLAAVTARQDECMRYVAWLSQQVETQLAEKVGRRVMMPPEFMLSLIHI